jgi:heme A synthase
MGWDHRSALGFMGFVLAWLAFFAIVGAANGQSHPPAPTSIAAAVGFGVRDSAEFLWHAAASI